MRTHLLETVTGKLGPVVLLFGFYVMLYGHLSPGGGFQGGVVVASGIVFLALGSSSLTTSGIIRPEILSRIEALAFLMLILVSISGILLGKGFLDNPMGTSSIIPAGFIILLNIIIGLKVGAGIGFMCIVMLGKE
ncbi:MAG: MnhB domain-containing protein [Spirochaetaceae bacterium]|nr:MnhB domain-containing protein [Spirochaetaceae bacterium]